MGKMRKGADIAAASTLHLKELIPENSVLKLSEVN